MTAGALLPPAGPPDKLELALPERAQAWKAAQNFEAMALGQLLQPMFDTVKSGDGAFGGGEGEDTWRPMLTQELAKQIAKSGGLGLAVPVYHQMLEMQEKAAHDETSRKPHGKNRI
jgi:peptidoglycan hydrolase FlgJ